MEGQIEPETLEPNNNSVVHSQNVEANVCPTRLIEDSPADEDLLSSDDNDIGPHERISQAIADLIQSDDPGGKMIGLEGGWGSGKTTIVNLIQKRLEADSNILVSTFDAWAHEGDPLRRTYLESIIEYFKGKEDWIDKKKWDDTLETLTKRLRTTITTTTPKITAFGSILAISAFLVPIGVPIIAAQLSSGITILNESVISQGITNPLLLSIGFILACAPLLVALGKSTQLLWRRIKHKSKISLEDFAILTGGTSKEITQDTTETPDPTSIEFERYFSDLIREALAEHNGRKVVLVIDNLDRVDPKSALSSWSTLQTFLQDREINKKEWFKQLWIIVPYDPAGLRQLWVNRGIKDDNKQEVPVSFIDKSFLVRFEVPPLVLSNWKTYLEKLAANAFPEHSEDDFHTIYSVYNLNRVDNNYTPTPRELKLYINQIGAIHRQWQHQFPIGHIAYYTILRRNSKNVRLGLLDGSIPDTKMVSILPPKLKPNLAGLFFNVQAKLGEELLLSDPIQNALQSNDGDSLRELENTHKDSFWAVLDEYITSVITGLQADEFTKIVLCLKQSGIIENGNRIKSNTVVKVIKKKASLIENWAPFDDDIANGIVIICSMSPNIEVSKRVVNNLRNTISEMQLEGMEESEEKEQSSQNIGVIINRLVIIFEAIHNLGHKDALAIPLTLPVDAEGWINACSHIKQHDKKYWLYFIPEAKFSDISEHLCSTVTEGHFSNEGLSTIQVTNSSPFERDWNPLVLSLSQRLNEGQNPTNEEANHLLASLSQLRIYGVNSVQLESKRLADEGHLMHNFHQAQSQNHVQCVAYYAVMFLENNPKAAKPPAIGNSDAGHGALLNLLDTDDSDVASHILRILRIQNNLKLLFSIADAREVYDPLLLRCIRIEADSETPATLFKPTVIIRYGGDLRNNLSEKGNTSRFEKLIKNLCVKSNLTKDIQKYESGFNHNNAGLYLTILTTSPSDLFCNWCRNGLENMSDSDWKSDFDNESDALILMHILVEAGLTVRLKRPFKDAIVVYAQDILSKRIRIPKNLVSYWANAFDVLGKGNVRKTLRRELLGAVINHSGKYVNGFFSIFGEEIADQGVLTEEKMVVHKLFTPLLKTRNIGGLQWLKNVFSTNPGIIDKFTDTASVQEFRERLQDEMNKSSKDQARELITGIANILGIKPNIAISQDETSFDNEKSEDSTNKE